MRWLSSLKDRAFDWLASRVIKSTRGERLWSQMIGLGAIGYPGSWSSDRTTQVQHFTGWNYVAIMALAEEVACQMPKVAMRYTKEEIERESRRGRIKSANLLSPQYIRKTFASLQPNEELEAVDHTHPLLRLLTNPNPPDTGMTFWMRTVIFLRLTGNAYWWVIPNSVPGRDERGLPGELWVLPSQWVWPHYSGESGTIIDYYDIRPYGFGMGGHRWLRIPAEDMVHFAYPGPIHPFDGYSPLQAGAQWVDVARSIDVSRFAQFKNNGWPGMTVEMPPDMNDPSDEDLDRFRAKLFAVYAGERNSGKLLIVPPGIKMSPQTRTAVEMDYVQSFDQSRDTELALHRVGKSIAGITEEVNRAGVTAARANFIYSTVRPLVMLIDGVITEKLANRFDERLLVYHDDKAPDDPQQKLQEWTAAADRGYCTPNEFRRAVLGLDGYEHGGDDPLVGADKMVLPLATGGGEEQYGDLPPEVAARLEASHAGHGTPAEGAANPQASQAAAEEQAGAVAGNDLRTTVGGLNAIAQLQKDYYTGSLPREAAMANVQLLFGFSDDESGRLFPVIAPKPLTDQPTEGGAPANGTPGGGDGQPGGEANRIQAMLAGKALVPADWLHKSNGHANGHATAPATAPAAAPAATDHKFSTTQFNLADLPGPGSDGVHLWQKIASMAESIPDEDLAGNGRELAPHITVKYGLHTDDPAEVAEIVRGLEPVVATLGKTSIFEGGEYDVVKVEVDSDELRRLNALLCERLECTDTHPEYLPHVTLAYVKPGEGQKYAGLTDVEGVSVKLGRLIFSDKKRRRTAIRLGDAVGKAADFDESKHPRASDGKFGSGGGASSPKADAARQAIADRKKAKEKRHAAAADRKKAARREARRQAIASVLDSAKQLGVTAADAAARVGRAVWDKLPPKMQDKMAKTWEVAKAVEHKLMTGFAVSKELATQVARDRGGSEKHVDRVARVVSVVDTVAAWTVTGPATLAATGSMTAAKVSSFMPVASLAYVSYSFARNPIVTIGAARKVIAKRKAGGAEHKSMDKTDAVAALFEAYGANDSDWFDALLHAALDETGGDMAAAIELAKGGLQDDPTGPEQEEAPAVSDQPEKSASASSEVTAPVPPVAQAKTYTCGPSALLAVCERFGVGATEQSLEEMLGTTSEDGTPPDAMLACCQLLDLDCEAKDGMTVEDLAVEVAKGNPVIVCMQAIGDPADGWDEGHWTVVIGVTPEKVLLHDPAPGKDVSVTREEFEQRWHDYETGGRQFVHYGLIVRGRTEKEAEVKAADWNESEHPRADDGKFGSGGGGASAGQAADKPAADKPASEKPTEPHDDPVARKKDAQERLGNRPPSQAIGDLTKMADWLTDEPNEQPPDDFDTDVAREKASELQGAITDFLGAVTDDYTEHSVKYFRESMIDENAKARGAEEVVAQFERGVKEEMDDLAECADRAAEWTLELADAADEEDDEKFAEAHRQVQLAVEDYARRAKSIQQALLDLRDDALRKFGDIHEAIDEDWQSEAADLAADVNNEHPDDAAESARISNEGLAEAGNPYRLMLEDGEWVYGIPDEDEDAEEQKKSAQKKSAMDKLTF